MVAVGDDAYKKRRHLVYIANGVIALVFMGDEISSHFAGIRGGWLHKAPLFTDTTLLCGLRLSIGHNYSIAEITG